MRPISNEVPTAYRPAESSWLRNVVIRGTGMPGCVVIPSTISWLRSTTRLPIRASFRRRSRSEPGDVLPGPRVDANDVALVDEQRDRHDESRLEGGRLPRALRRVAGEAGLGRGHRQVDRHRQLDPDRLALVGGSIERHPVLEVVLRVVELVGAKAELVVR